MPLNLRRHFDVLLVWAGRVRNQQRFPQTCNAIRDLCNAAKNERGPKARRSQLQAARPRAPVSHRVALWRAKKKIADLTSEVENNQSSKGVHGLLSQTLILRVILTAPNVSGRAMAEAFHLVVGSDRSMVSVRA